MDRERRFDGECLVRRGVLLGGTPGSMSPRVLAGLFFVAVVGAPTVALAWHLAGRRIGLAALAAVVALSAAQTTLPVRAPLVVGGNWPVLLASGQVARHRLAVPASARSLIAATGGAFIYVCTVDALQREELEVGVSGKRLGALGPSQH